MKELLIYTETQTPRLIYTFGLIFRDLLKIQYRITTDKNVFLAYAGARLNYSEQAFSDELFCYATPLLFEKGISDQTLSVFDWEGTKVFFGTHPRYLIPFDVFSASFYLVSRYEEYLPHIKDEHQRYVPSQSLAAQKNFLEIPQVNIWANHLKEKIKSKFPEFQFPDPQYRFISTIDVDSVYSFKEKGFVRVAAGFLRSILSLQTKEVVQRAQVILGFEKDPFDTFEYQQAIHKKFKTDVISFFLVGDYDEYDKNIPWDSRSFRKLIRGVADYSKIGLHPSYASNGNPKKLKMEINRLSSMLNREIHISRQHFLKMTFPQTYRRLLEHDITEDHTMGYASLTGFRASICSPFYFYDLDMEQETRLRITPFALMDGTLKDRMNMKPEEALAHTKKLVDRVKEVGGTFVSLWHNHSFDESGEWAGWNSVYEAMCDYAKP